MMSFDDESIYEENDDDIFGSSKPTSSGRKSEIPTYLSTALQRYIKENPKFKESFTDFKETFFLSQFIATLSLFDGMLIKTRPFHAAGPLVKTLVQILDRSTEGQVQRNFAAYSLEPVLTNLHLNLSLVSDTYQALLDENFQGNQLADSLLVYLETLAEIYSFSIRSVSDDYIEACQLANIIPDDSIIQFGIRKESNFADSIASHSTQILAHYQYGDVSEITTLYESITRKGFIKQFIPLVAKFQMKTSEMDTFSNELVS